MYVSVVRMYCGSYAVNCYIVCVCVCDCVCVCVCVCGCVIVYTYEYEYLCVHNVCYIKCCAKLKKLIVVIFD